MDKFTILFLLGACASIFIPWANSVKEDKYAFKTLSILGCTALAWFFVYGLYHVVMKLLEN